MYYIVFQSLVCLLSATLFVWDACDSFAHVCAYSEDSRDSGHSEKYILSGGLAQCPDCPYRGKTKDLNAHRRLHRERPGAEHKCPECNYWVTHSRLLQQHAKVLIINHIIMA